MRLLFLFGSLLVAATTVAQTQKASDVADFVSASAVTVRQPEVTDCNLVNGTERPFGALSNCRELLSHPNQS
jgi:hypothetical protein